MPRTKITYNKNKTINNVSTSIISSSIIVITIISVVNNITSNTIITESNNYNKEIIPYLLLLY